ncbi:MAG TPA: hypothetical protein VHY37_01260, partial [Tepidisphaeraceae bacterium]|nr:hypothetical protein [Tepidisphaeraceae bacterium]
NHKWLIYLPPTMSPTETSTLPGLLEHPREAFDYFRSNGVGTVICEEKHMGSRAVVVVCRDGQAAVKRFGVADGSAGIIYTRTGRRFFDDAAVETELLGILREAISAARWWEEFASDWFVLDCELMPWSAKAQELLRTQYAAVGSAAIAAGSAAVAAIRQGMRRDGDNVTALAGMLTRQEDRLDRSNRFVSAYRQYCWPVAGVADLKLAPFHLLASEGHVHAGQDHHWHMHALARLASGPIIATAHRAVNVTVPSEVAGAIEWWETLTGAGGEGMVVKPMEFVVRGSKGLVQPAVKCRGPEYLRIIYGPDYDALEHLERLRQRGLGPKRSLAIREFALGIEGLERFARREPLRRVHECVFGVLAMESEPVDPRL